MSTLSRLLDISESSEHVPRVALGYLVGLSVAEVTTVLLHAQLGLVLHGSLLVTLMLHSALTWEQPGHKLLFTLAFAPLIRILSLSLPMVGLPLLYWYLVTSVPLIVASVVAIRTLGFSWAGVGLNLRALPSQLLVGLTGLGFGYVEYQILKPPALARALTWDELWIPILILMFSTGFLEELIFRGMMQRAATEALGRFGLPYVAVLFAVLHVGYLSVLDVVFVLIVGLFFGWAAARTRSIVGVTLSHGLTNIVLFLVVPLSPVFNPPEAPLTPGTPVPLPATPTPAVTVPVTPTVTPTAAPAASWSVSASIGWGVEEKKLCTLADAQLVFASVGQMSAQYLGYLHQHDEGKCYEEWHDARVQEASQRLSPGARAGRNHLLLYQEGEQGQDSDQGKGSRHDD